MIGLAQMTLLLIQVVAATVLMFVAGVAGAAGAKKIGRKYGFHHPIKSWRRTGQQGRRVRRSMKGAAARGRLITTEVRNAKSVKLAGMFGRGLTQSAGAAASYRPSSGRCRKCKRKLVDPESKRIGLGPECRPTYATYQHKGADGSGRNRKNNQTKRSGSGDREVPQGGLDKTSLRNRSVVDLRSRGHSVHANPDSRWTLREPDDRS